MDSFIVAEGNAISPVPSPTHAFGGDPAPIPGVVEAEEFDEGGEGVGYSDTTASNFGGVRGAVGTESGSGFGSGSGAGSRTDSGSGSGVDSGYKDDSTFASRSGSGYGS